MFSSLPLGVYAMSVTTTKGTVVDEAIDRKQLLNALPHPHSSVTCGRSPPARAFRHPQQKGHGVIGCVFWACRAAGGHARPSVGPGCVPVGGTSQRFVPTHRHTNPIASGLGSGSWVMGSDSVHLPVKHQELGESRTDCTSAK